FRYGHLPTQLLGRDTTLTGAKTSIWWKDIIGLGRGVEDDWFKLNVACCVGDGRVVGNDEHSLWSWQWTVQSLEIKEQQLKDLKELLLAFSLHPNSHDRWRWLPGIASIFFVKSCYQWLLEHRQEDCSHLFFHCAFSKGVWESVYRWLGMKSISAGAEGWNHFLLFDDMITAKKGERVRHLFWLATTWNIWKLRNNVVFNGVIPNASSLVEDIIANSWLWFNGRYGHHSCTSMSFSNWCHDHMTCIQRM
ncbi:hypothetical protein L195_g040495, partial [Trifolium pratense]